MGVQEIVRLACDGPGCDLVAEHPRDDESYSGMQVTNVMIGHIELWRGVLCDACRQEMNKRLNCAITTRT